MKPETKRAEKTYDELYGKSAAKSKISGAAKKYSLYIFIAALLIAICIHYFGVRATFSPEVLETNLRNYGDPKSEDLENFLHISILVKAIILFVLTSVGIVFQTIYHSKKFSIELTNLKPLLVAPIVFYPVYLISKTQTDNIVSFILAFQNGFFWQAIFNKAKQSSV